MMPSWQPWGRAYWKMPLALINAISDFFVLHFILQQKVPGMSAGGTMTVRFRTVHVGVRAVDQRIPQADRNFF